MRNTTRERPQASPSAPTAHQLAPGVALAQLAPTARHAPHEILAPLEDRDARATEDTPAVRDKEADAELEEAPAQEKVEVLEGLAGYLFISGGFAFAFAVLMGGKGGDGAFVALSIMAIAWLIGRAVKR